MTTVRFKNPNATSPFDAMFNDFFKDVTRPVAKTEPAINIIESGTEFRIEVAAPGLSKADFKVNVEKDVLTISAEKKVEETETEENFTRREFFYNKFSRTFSLHESVDTTKIHAKYDQGILNLILPKREEAKALPAREIEIG